MSHFADYYLEKDGKRSIETEDGFLVYKTIEGITHVYIFYLKPEARKGSAWLKFYNKLVEIEKPAYMTCAIDTEQNNCTAPLKLFLFIGFEIIGIEGKSILLGKEIKDATK